MHLRVGLFSCFSEDIKSQVYTHLLKAQLGVGSHTLMLAPLERNNWITGSIKTRNMPPLRGLRQECSSSPPAGRWGINIIFNNVWFPILIHFRRVGEIGPDPVFIIKASQDSFPCGIAAVIHNYLRPDFRYDPGILFQLTLKLTRCPA